MGSSTPSPWARLLVRWGQQRSLCSIRFSVSWSFSRSSAALAARCSWPTPRAKGWRNAATRISQRRSCWCSASSSSDGWSFSFSMSRSFAFSAPPMKTCRTFSTTENGSSGVSQATFCRSFSAHFCATTARRGWRWLLSSPAGSGIASATGISAFPSIWAWPVQRSLPSAAPVCRR